VVNMCNSMTFSLNNKVYNIIINHQRRKMQRPRDSDEVRELRSVALAERGVDERSLYYYAIRRDMRDGNNYEDIIFKCLMASAQHNDDYEDLIILIEGIQDYFEDCRSVTLKVACRLANAPPFSKVRSRMQFQNVMAYEFLRTFRNYFNVPDAILIIETVANLNVDARNLFISYVSGRVNNFLAISRAPRHMFSFITYDTKMLLIQLIESEIKHAPEPDLLSFVRYLRSTGRTNRELGKSGAFADTDFIFDK